VWIVLTVVFALIASGEGAVLFIDVAPQSNSTPASAMQTATLGLSVTTSYASTNNATLAAEETVNYQFNLGPANSGLSPSGTSTLPPGDVDLYYLNVTWSSGNCETITVSGSGYSVASGTVTTSTRADLCNGKQTTVTLSF
jgi:hypothetical protein